MTRLTGKAKDKKRKDNQKAKKIHRQRYLKSLRAEILTHDSSELSEVSVDLTKDDDVEFIQKMKKVLCSTPYGVGLAANQIGETKRVIVLRTDSDSRLVKAMINPVILKKSDETEVRFEGCLSYPGEHCPISRSLEVEVSYTDEKWAQKTGEFVGLEARILQHEIDHLDGICKVKDSSEAVELNETSEQPT